MTYRYAIIVLIITTLFLKLKQMYTSYQKKEYIKDKSLSLDLFLLVLIVIISVLLFNSTQ
jgi:Na+/H+ antiporter NhaC